MRVYLSPALQQVISTTILCLALGGFGWVVWTAVTVWSGDPTLEEIQRIQAPN